MDAVCICLAGIEVAEADRRVGAFSWAFFGSDFDLETDGLAATCCLTVDLSFPASIAAETVFALLRVFDRSPAGDFFVRTEGVEATRLLFLSPGLLLAAVLPGDGDTERVFTLDATLLAKAWPELTFFFADSLTCLLLVITLTLFTKFLINC